MLILGGGFVLKSTIHITFESSCSIFKEKKIMSSATTPTISTSDGMETILHEKVKEMGPWRKESIKVENAFKRMRKNLTKSIQEHNTPFQADCSKKSPYMQVSDLSIDLTPKKPTSLQFSPQFYSSKGFREQNEDAHFYLKIDTEKTKGTLVGVLDGHGGTEVSQFASNEFQKRFPDALKKADGNVHTAFENVIDQIHQEVARKSDWDEIGTVGVICYIDEETHFVYTATLSDCEANIYRQMGEEMKSIPLSPQRNWLSSRDLDRLKKYHTESDVVEYLDSVDNDPKEVFSNLSEGINTPRAIGDVIDRGIELPLVVHKPKITVDELKPGDVLTLACDGLKDFVSEREIIAIVKSEKKRPSFALCHPASYKMNKNDCDNVTVGVIHVS